MTFKAGQSGNPKGRPLKNRTLTGILEKAGNLKQDMGNAAVTRKQLLADLLWQAATTGTVTFPDGFVRTLDIQDWSGVVKFIYQHIDGPPKAEVDITSGGDPLFITLDK